MDGTSTEYHFGFLICSGIYEEQVGSFQVSTWIWDIVHRQRSSSRLKYSPQRWNALPDDYTSASASNWRSFPLLNSNEEHAIHWTAKCAWKDLASPEGSNTDSPSHNTTSSCRSCDLGHGSFHCTKNLCCGCGSSLIWHPSGSAIHPVILDWWSISVKLLYKPMSSCGYILGYTWLFLYCMWCHAFLCSNKAS